MAQMLITSVAQISHQMLFYIENEAEQLSNLDDFAIENYMDREINNPLFFDLLSSDSMDQITAGYPVSNQLNLSFREQMVTNILPNSKSIQTRLGRLKELIRKTLCDILGQLGEGDVKVKDIISAILIALLPIFGSGIPALLLPIIIGITAFFLKKGKTAICG